MTEAEQIARNVREIRDKIELAAARFGRSGRDISLVAAAKQNDAARVRAAVLAGIDAVGENRVQELMQKLPEGAYEGAPLHFIGHLQTNKVKSIVGVCDVIESVGSERLLDEIDRHSKRLGIRQDVLIEVNIGREPGKSGVQPEALVQLLEFASAKSSIFVRGLMAIPPFSVTGGVNRVYFDDMLKLFIDIQGKTYDNISMQLLSMGMSDSYELAIECGANMVRVGSAIFGSRYYT